MLALRSLLACAVLLSTAPAIAVELAPPEPTSCSGEYADDFGALSRAARDFDEKSAPYTFCVRTTAVYECPSYVADGSLRQSRVRVVGHGTAFGFRKQGTDTLLVTNEHIATWPAATDAEHVVENVPAGCRRVSQELRVVDDESDAYDRDDIPLATVVTDPQLDVAVLRAKVALPVLPWRIGHSAGLRERNVVDVRGFPLGVLRANSVGKVVSALDHDEQREWHHDDFVIDALLSHGNSGSPVLAISCRTGELELVGIYHAGYEASSALHVVVGIDQVRDLMSTLRRSVPKEGAAPVAGRDRQSVDGFVAAAPARTFQFPFGPSVAGVHARPDGALVFEIHGRDFPLDAGPRLVFEDLPPRAPLAFGTVGRIWAGNRQGLRLVDRAHLDADTLVQLGHVLDALRRNAAQSVQYAVSARGGLSSRERFKEVARVERGLRRTIADQQDLAQGALEIADRLCPTSADASDDLGAALRNTPGPASLMGAKRAARR